MDFEAFRYPAIAAFSFGLAVEALLTAKLFFHRDNLPVSAFMKWWAVSALLFMSSCNCYAAIDVYVKNRLDSSLFVKLAFSLAGQYTLLWVYVFHLDKWRNK